MTSAAQGDALRIDLLPQGSSGTVLEIRGHADETFRLKAMGICRGRRVMLLRRGDPLILCVLGSRIGVSARLAGKVYVVADPDDRGEGPAA